MSAFFAAAASTSNNNGSANCNHYVVPAFVPEANLTHKGEIPHRGRFNAAQTARGIRHSYTVPSMAQRNSRAASGSKSGGATDGSHNARTPVHTSSHIKRDTITPLPKADPIHRAKTHGPGSNRGIRANLVEVFKFQREMKAGGFPLLVPSHFLSVAEDRRMNAGPSFSKMAARGVKPGAKLSPRSPTSLLPSWNETWMKAEDWIPVPKGQENIFQWGLGVGFRAQYECPWEVIDEADEMASADGTFGDVQMERVNRWLAQLYINSIPLLDSIELMNAYGDVIKMLKHPNKPTVQRGTYKKAIPPPLPMKFHQSSSEFPIKNNRKGKGKAVSPSQENKLFKELVEANSNQILGALKITETPKLDYVIEKALLGDTWYEPKRFEDRVKELKPCKKHLPSSRIKEENINKPIYNDAQKGNIIETVSRETRMAERHAIQKGHSFEVNLTIGSVMHTPKNLVWEIPGYCYLAAINIAIPHDGSWPQNPTIYNVAKFRYKYQKLQLFKLVETVPAKHFTLKMLLEKPYRVNTGWQIIDQIAQSLRSYMMIGGDNDNSSTIKILDGTNYQQWAPKMEAYLKSKKLWYYVSGDTPAPSCIDQPAEPTPLEGSTTITSSQKAEYKELKKAYNEQYKICMAWNQIDDKALSLIQLKMGDKLQYLVKEKSEETWDNIKKQFDVSGPAAIFNDFKWIIEFKFDERKEPSIQVAELNTQLNRLATHDFNLDSRIQAMIILSSLPSSWDSVLGAILVNQNIKTLDINSIMPYLQEEWQCRHARKSKTKASHLARGNICGGPQRQQWQGNQQNYQQNSFTPQAGPSNYNNSYKPAPYNKFGKKPNFNANNQKPGYLQSQQKGPNWQKNFENCTKKKFAKLVQVQEEWTNAERNQDKPDKKGKGKEKAVKSANLLARIDDEILLLNRMEGIESYKERVFIAPDSEKTNKVVTQMDIDDEVISLGDDYEDAREFYANNGELDGENWDKYGNGLSKKAFANSYHTVKTMEEMARMPLKSSLRYSSTVLDNTAHKTVLTVNRVIIVFCR